MTLKSNSGMWRKSYNGSNDGVEEKVRDENVEDEMFDVMTLRKMVKTERVGLGHKLEGHRPKAHYFLGFQTINVLKWRTLNVKLLMPTKSKSTERKKDDSLMPKLSQVSFKNIKGTSTTSSGVPCEGVALGEISLTLNGAPVTAKCSNVKPSSFLGSLKTWIHTMLSLIRFFPIPLSSESCDIPLNEDDDFLFLGRTRLKQ
ncbi:hypothetical protein RIF29_23920 [Crotalaria pallida]|uniref:Uncharacterized protein n=1 Tax=Crotalaria pallida TaxID=3830 RepID=A0AAN9EIV2_CROPI